MFEDTPFVYDTYMPAYTVCRSVFGLSLLLDAILFSTSSCTINLRHPGVVVFVMP